MPWYIEAIIATCGFAVMILLSKQISNMGLTSSSVMLFYFCVTGACFYFIHSIVFKEPIAISLNIFWVLLLASFFGYIGNVCYFNSIIKAPNPGYPMLINGLQSVFVVFISVYLFGSSLGIRQIIGTVLCFVGSILLIL